MALPLWARESRTGQLSPQKIVEQRIYSAESVMPPRSLLERHGVLVEAIRKDAGRVEYVMRFDSLEARARAWDGFNSDAEWAALRQTGEVRVTDILLSVHVL